MSQQQPQQQKTVNSNPRKTGLLLTGVVVLMFGFGYAMVPLYEVFCEITGLNGRTSSTTNAAEIAADNRVDLSRTVTVNFVATLSSDLPWEFRPVVASMQVHPGQLYTTEFFARNGTGRDTVARAVPSVAPGVAAKYFQKTECFCFTEQAFKAGEGKQMPVTFMVHPDLPPDIDRVALSYTFFESEQGKL